MKRLRTSFGVTGTGSDSSQHAMNEHVDLEKPSETKLEVHTQETITEDERFEWGEVLRGANIRSLNSEECF